VEGFLVAKHSDAVHQGLAIELIQDLVSGAVGLLIIVKILAFSVNDFPARGARNWCILAEWNHRSDSINGANVDLIIVEKTS
jgi:hypothetical protein